MCSLVVRLTRLRHRSRSVGRPTGSANPTIQLAENIVSVYSDVFVVLVPPGEYETNTGIVEESPQTCQTPATQ